VEFFKHLGSTLTNDGRCTCEIKSRNVTAKAAFNKKTLFTTSKLDLNLRKKLVKCYTWNLALYMVCPESIQPINIKKSNSLGSIEYYPLALSSILTAAPA
jgi:hypothetical protein